MALFTFRVPVGTMNYTVILRMGGNAKGVGRVQRGAGVGFLLLALSMWVPARNLNEIVR